MAKKITKIFAVLAMFLFVTSGLFSERVFAAAANFELQAINNGKVSLSSYKGKQPVMLFFWTTWCPFCRTELKTVTRRYDELAASGLEVLAIDVGEQGNKVASYLKNSPVSFKVLLDTDTSVATSYNVMGVPTFVLIDKEGQIVSQGNGFPEGYQNLINK